MSALVKDWSDLRTIIGECGGIDRLRNLAEADKDGRLVVLEASDDTAADVAPVVRSRWRYCGFLQECQTCGEIYSMHGGNAGKSWNYCPNCGAKMDLEEDTCEM